MRQLKLPNRSFATSLKVAAGVFVLSSLIYVVTGFVRVDAATAVLVPNLLTSVGWTGSYSNIDEGEITTPDYINSGTGGAVSGSYGMSDMNNVSSASSISVYVCAYSATNANGGTLDTLTVNITINGIAQTAQTFTPTYSATSTCTLYNPLIVNGTYAQSDINSLNISLSTTVKGSGNPSSQIDDIRVANAYMKVTYSPSIAMTQSNYRLYNPQDSTTPGSPLAAQNTQASVLAGANFRLRQLLASTYTATAGTAFKLQYAAKVGTCDTSFSGETYADIVTTGTNEAGSVPTSAVNAQPSSWANPGAAIGADSSGAYFEGGGGVSGAIKLTGFGFNIPTGATIDGITASVRRMQTGTMSGGDVQDYEVNIIKGGTIGTTNKANTTQAWTVNSYSTYDYGGTADKWGETWTPNDINASDFGLAYNILSNYNNFEGNYGRANLDSVSIAVTYTETATGNQYIQYANMTNTHSGVGIAAGANDPTGGATIVPQMYVEGNPAPISTDLAVNDVGMWDFSLKAGSNAAGSYCIRTVNSDGSLLNAYSRIPEITVQPSSLTQADYRWLSNADSTSPAGALALQDTATTVAPDTAVRLRQRIAVDSGTYGVGVESLKLQYAEKVGICDPSFTGESYVDLGATTGSVSQLGTLASEDTSGDVTWGNVDTLNQDDDNYVGVGSNGADRATNKATLTGYNFNIPTNATVTGVSVSFPYQASGYSTGYLPGLSAGLVIGGTKQPYVISTDVSNNTAGTTTIGGSSSLFNQSSISPAQINASNFGVYVSAIARYDSYTADDSTIVVDDARVTVYYTIPNTVDFYDNATPASGSTISSSASDPTNGARGTVYQTYQEASPFTTTSSIASGSDGLWDFSLKPAASADGKTYCFRAVRSDGSLLNSYSQIPELTVGSTGPTLDQQMRGGQYVIGGTKGKFTW